MEADILESILSEIWSFIKTLFFIMVIIGCILAYIYNKLQRLGQTVKATNSNVLTVIQKRADLVNKLMDIAKEYGNHEKLTYIKLSDNLVNTFKESNAAIANVTAMANNYPDLKANSAYQQLMLQINDIENELQKKRENYNFHSREYNACRLQVPIIFVADILGFKEAPYFDFDNLDKINDFKTDDGEVLKEILSTASNKAMDLTQKSIEKVQEKLKKD